MKSDQRKYLPALQMMCGDLEAVEVAEYIAWATTAVSEYYPTIHVKERNAAVFFLSALTSDVLPVLFRKETMAVDAIPDALIDRAIQLLSGYYGEEGIGDIVMTIYKAMAYESVDIIPSETYVDKMTFHTEFFLRLQKAFWECHELPNTPELSDIKIAAPKRVKATATAA